LLQISQTWSDIIPSLGTLLAATVRGLYTINSPLPPGNAGT
jgi:hypothetical protein